MCVRDISCSACKARRLWNLNPAAEDENEIKHQSIAMQCVPSPPPPRLFLEKDIGDDPVGLIIWTSFHTKDIYTIQCVGAPYICRITAPHSFQTVRFLTSEMAVIRYVQKGIDDQVAPRVASVPG